MQFNVDKMFLRPSTHPAMAAGGGAIVNVSSISALRPRGLTVYSVSKGAVIALTRAMAVDHGRENIRVNCVAPGPVYTPMVYERGMSPAARDRRRQASALGIEGTAGPRNAVPSAVRSRALVTGQRAVSKAAHAVRAQRDYSAH